MGWSALGLALFGGLAVALPSPGLYIGVGVALMAAAAGVIAYRRRGDRSGSRLAGAASVVLAGLAVGLATARYLMILGALGRLESLF